MSQSDPHFIPALDRAEGEPGVGGLWRYPVEDRAAALTAPEIWEAYRQQFPGYWVQMAVETLQRDGQPVSILTDFLPDPAKADRTPLRLHLNHELRAGRWACFGFSERDEKRVRIVSPWREGLTFDDAGGMTTAAGSRYSDVLFYETAATNPGVTALPPSGSPRVATAPTAPPPPPRKRGRPSHAEEDKPLIEEMWRSIAVGDSLSRAAAAKQVVGRAGGSGTNASKVARLVKGYGEKYDSRPS